MKESDLKAGLSWKQGFLSNKLKGKMSTQALQQVVAKRIKEKQCPCLGKTQNESQRTFLTGEVVPYCPEPAAATDPDSPSLLNITIAPAPNLRICQESSHHDSQALNTICSRTAPRTSHTHDSHIHRALPVCRLLPEQESIDDTLATMHNTQEGMPLPMTEKPFITTGQKLRNNRYEPHEPITATTRFAMAHNQIA